MRRRPDASGSLRTRRVECTRDPKSRRSGGQPAARAGELWARSRIGAGDQFAVERAAPDPCADADDPAGLERAHRIDVHRLAARSDGATVVDWHCIQHLRKRFDGVVTYYFLMPVSTPPRGLELVIDFVNTYDAETDVDELATPAGVATWFTDRKLLTRDAGTIGAT